MESTITTQIFNTTLSEKTHWAVAIFVSLAIIGFLPSYLYFAETSDWVLIVSYPGEGYPEWLQGKAYEQAKNALSTHTVFAAIWLFVLMSQAWAGATKGKRRRQFHVITGKYISPFILIPTLSFAIGALYFKQPDYHRNYSFQAVNATFVMCAIGTLYCCGVAYWAVVKWKDFTKHKDYILMSAAIFVIPGTDRIVLYFMQAFSDGECSVLEREPLAFAAFGISTAISLVAIAPSWISMKRLKEKRIQGFAAFLSFLVVWSAANAIGLAAKFGNGCCCN
ncbi:hypothetical protein ScalyP_jg4296 [Parmales sp. scaly parma]|nr:hypothetical protein ScalyP_jg4296 [Parmales sp. scaly parma]